MSPRLILLPASDEIARDVIVLRREVAKLRADVARLYRDVAEARALAVEASDDLHFFAKWGRLPAGP